MADIRDVVAADQEVEVWLNKLDQNQNIKTMAIVRAIQALGIRIDYVLRDLELKQSIR